MTKFHLKKAGLDSLTVSLSVANTVIGGAVDMALLYSEMARKAGINIDVVREPDDGYWSNVWLKKPFCMSGWGQRPTADIIVTLGYAAGPDWNESHFKDEKFNQLLNGAKAELDNKKRGAMYSEMQRILNSDGGTISPSISATLGAWLKLMGGSGDEAATCQFWETTDLRNVDKRIANRPAQVEIFQTSILR